MNEQKETIGDNYHYEEVKMSCEEIEIREFSGIINLTIQRLQKQQQRGSQLVTQISQATGPSAGLHGGDHEGRGTEEGRH